MKKNLLLITLCFFVFSCKKETSEIKKSETTPKITVQEAKDFLNDLPTLQTNSQNSSGFDAKSLLEKIDWKSATLVDSGKVLTGKFEGKPTENNFETGFRKAVFRKDESGKLILNILEFIPEIYHLWKYKGINSNSFDGKIMIYDDKYKLIHGYKYEGGKIKAEILPVKESQLRETSTLKNDLSVTTCTQEAFTYLSAQGTYEATFILKCTTEYFFNYGASSQLQQVENDYTQELIDIGGGGITPIQTLPILFIPGQDNAQIDIKKFIKCFGTTDNYNNSYKFSVYVDQPINGSTSSSVAGGGDKVNVGHAFIGITKTTSAGSFTQYIGFYPANSISGFLPLGHKFVNNQNYPYDVSITFDIPYHSFQSLINAANNYNNDYNMWTNNCTNFALEMANAAQVYIPNTQGNSLISRTPGQLGEDLRQYKRSYGPGVGVNDAGGESGASKGPCN